MGGQGRKEKPDACTIAGMAYRAGLTTGRNGNLRSRKKTEQNGSGFPLY
jgi:hypothetical protein